MARVCKKPAQGRRLLLGQGNRHPKCPEWKSNGLYVGASKTLSNPSGRVHQALSDFVLIHTEFHHVECIYHQSRFFT